MFEGVGLRCVCRKQRAARGAASDAHEWGPFEAAPIFAWIKKIKLSEFFRGIVPLYVDFDCSRPALNDHNL